MIALITTKTVPPGGWQYTQLDAQGDKLKSFASMNPFGMFCGEVLNCRQGNRLDRATKAQMQQDVIEFTCERLGNDPRFCQDSQKKTPGLFSALSEGAAHAIDALKKQVTGVLVVGDYVLHGSKPIAIAQSQARADVCTGRLSGKPCPRHVQNWNYNLATQAVIRMEMEKRAKAGRKLIQEDTFKTCSVCGCWLPLKVDVPFITIWKHTSDSMFNEFPTETPCWISQERKESKLTA